jgi:hypothetical protein
LLSIGRKLAEGVSYGRRQKMMWLVLIGLPITLWIISLLIWLLWKWIPPGNEVRHPPEKAL